LEEHQCERVAIIDLDIHHGKTLLSLFRCFLVPLCCVSFFFLGNGTEDIVRRYQHPSRLFFFSIHLYDHDAATNYHFYPGTGGIDDYVRVFFLLFFISVYPFPSLLFSSRLLSSLLLSSPLLFSSRLVSSRLVSSLL
jgi:hypothetical protein